MSSPPHSSESVAEGSLPVRSARESAVPGPLTETRRHAGVTSRLIALFPGGQFVRYLCTGVWNTLFGFSTYALFVALLAHVLPARWLALNALLASLLSTPINITMAFFCYKIFVFRTRGNYLVEWLRCFAVYGTSMIPGLLALSGLTRLFQTLLNNHRGALSSTMVRLPLGPSTLGHIHHLAQGKNLAAYLAGGLLMAFTTVFSFIGHKTFSFRQAKSTRSPGNP